MRHPIVTRADVIAYRVGQHQLDRAPHAATATDVDLLDLGVQDTGTGGSAWALEIRGARPAESDDLVMAWTLRGAPHVYRRDDIAAITVATAPFSEADAASRVFDASKPLRDNGIPVLAALTNVATTMRDIARKPIAKGAMSAALTERLEPPYLRACRPCNATHIYEQPFRLSALQAGLELESGTSPPVLMRIPGVRPAPYRHLGTSAATRFDVIRGYLRFFGPATVKAIATFLEAPVADIKANLPDDAVEVDVDGLPSKVARYILADDLERLSNAHDVTATGIVRLLGSHDPYLQTRDREVLVADTARQKDLWRIIGRPGAVLVDGEVMGTWRPRTSAKKLAIRLDRWAPWSRRVHAGVVTEAERLAAHRGLVLGTVDGL